MAWPSIAIVTPSLNRRQFLPACLASVLDQGYPALQFVVMDGGSTDGSVEIIRAQADRLHFWRSRPDDGPHAAIAEGFSASDADILGWIGADDVLLPWALGIVGGIFRDCPDVEWITTETPLELAADGLPYTSWRIPGFTADGFRRRENLAAPGAPAGASFIQAESTFWRRSLWQRSGARLDPTYKYAGDFELWDRFFDHAQLYSIDLPLGAFRRHGDAQASVGARQQYIAECEAILARHGAVRPNLHAYLGRRARLAGMSSPELDKFREPINVVRRRADGRFFTQVL